MSDAAGFDWKRAALRAAYAFSLALAPLPADAASGDEAQGTRSLDDDFRLISSVIDSVERMKAVVHLPEASPFWSAKVDRQLAVFRENREGLRKYMAGSPKADLATVMRVNPELFGQGGEAWTGLGAPFNNARDTLMEFANHPQIQPLLLTALGGDSAVISITRPITDIHLLQLRAGIERNTEKLRRYRIKYGPTSARLNLLETALNYWAFQWAPGIRSNAEGPGHLELIAGYSTSYLILYRTGAGDFTSSPALTSVFEAGFRWYIFRPGWGGTGIVDRVVMPSYVTVGGLIGDGEDGFLRLPVGDGFRWGLFGSWGGLKLALHGLNDWDTSQLLLSRQFQFIPYFF